MKATDQKQFEGAAPAPGAKAIPAPQSLDALRALVREAEDEGGDFAADDVFDEAEVAIRASRGIDGAL
jgi:hypothetical protein